MHAKPEPRHPCHLWIRPIRVPVTVRVPAILLPTLLLIVAGCRQTEPVQPQMQQPPILESPATQPEVIIQPPPPTIEPLPGPESPATQPRRFDVSRIGINPDRPLSILEKMRADRPARVAASLQTDNLLVVDTENVARLQLDMLNLPRRQAGRLILRLDGQGLEITGRANRIVYLQRDTVGNWTFARPPEPVPGGSRSAP